MANPQPLKETPMSRKSLRARRVAKLSLRQERAHQHASRVPKHPPSLITNAKAAATTAKQTADFQSLVNVPNGVRILGLPPSYSARVFGKGGANTATLKSISRDQACIRTSYGTFMVQRKLLKPAMTTANPAPKIDKFPNKSIKFSYPAGAWREVVPGLEMFYPSK